MLLKNFALKKKSQVQNWQEKTYRNYILLLSDLCLNMHQLFGMAALNKTPKQLTAARIVTELPNVVSREALYYETGLETLKTRRYVAKMTNMFKIHTGGVPE